MNTNNEKNTWENVFQNTISLLKTFFINYLWLGVVLILTAAIIDVHIPKKEFYITVGVNLLSSIGIAILVAAIFTFASGTSEFIGKIKTLLQDIVVSRDFLSNIDTNSKREAIYSLIKPSTEEKLIYSNIEDYLNTYIKQTMEVTNKCVRSNYIVNARAFIDKTKNKVFVHSSITYRLYPTKDGYSDIKVGFLSEEKESTCKSITINTPHGERVVIKEEELKFEEKTIDAGKAKMATVDLSEHDKNCNHLDISLELLEAGEDHWQMLSFCALMPTDGFKHTLRCEDGLVVNAFQTFIHGAKYHTDKHSNSEIQFSCHEWINEGTGISILISAGHPSQKTINA